MEGLGSLILTVLLVVGWLAVAAFLTWWLIKKLSSKRAGRTVGPMNVDAKEQAVLLAIEVPKENEKTPLAAETMFASLHGIGDHRLSFEIEAKEKSVRFYVWTPVSLRNYVESQFYAQYPDMNVIEMKDYADVTQISENTAGASTDLLFTNKDFFPIKTFLNFTVDPLAAITGMLGKLAEGERIWIQLVVSPESNKWRDRAMAFISAVKAGRSPEIGVAITKSLFSLMSDVVGSIMRGSYEPKKEGAKVELSPGTDLMLKSVEEKSSKLGFKTKIRLVVWDKDEASAKAKLQLALGTFKQFDSTNLNSFKPGKYIADRSEILANYGNRTLGKDAVILNVTELASIYHLPNVSVATPNIVWAGSRKGEPPANLPLVGEVPAEELTTLATTNFRGTQEKFGIKLKDRHRHIYIIGKSGVGKSTLLENMSIDDIRERRGVGVIDPHGDYVDTVLKYVPNYRVNDVILFDPGDRDYPIAINMLELRDPKYKVVVASGVVGIFKKIFGYSWGPRLEYWLSSAVMALLDYPDSTLMMIPQLFTDLSFREKVIAKIGDPLIKARWVNEYGKLDQKQQNETISPILNKVGQFLSSPVIRNIVGQPKSSIDFREVMDDGKILLVKLAKGIIGEDNAALLGAMIITQLQLAAMSRADTEEKARKDFYLYVDEFQNFATESFQVILSEARKYHLSLTLANQYMEQLIPEVSDAIFGNVNTIITFRVGGDDAKKLEKEFTPVFEANDLVNLNMFNIYIKLSIDNITTNAFSAQTLPLPDEINNNEEKILKISREHYSRPASFVEEKITKALEIHPMQPQRSPYAAAPKQQWAPRPQSSTTAQPPMAKPQQPSSQPVSQPQPQRGPFGAAANQPSSQRSLPNRPVPFRPALKVQTAKPVQSSAPAKRKPDDSLLKKVISAMEQKKPWVPGDKPSKPLAAPSDRGRANPVADLNADKKPIEDIRRQKSEEAQNKANESILLDDDSGTIDLSDQQK